MRLARFLAFVGFLLFSQLSSALDAPPGLIPPGLNPGDEFFIIFAGSDTLDGAQTAATYAAYAATVKANDPDTNAISGWITLFGHDDSSLVTTSAFGGNTSQPIYNTNGDKVADNRAELFSDAQDSAIGYDEQGNVNANNIWTGFNHTGTPTGIGDDSLGGNDWLNDGCLAGDASRVDHNWAASVLVGGAGCAGANLGLYVLSPLLSVPAPVVSIAPGPLNFGSLEVGTTSSDATVILSNTGTADWEISSIDAAAAPFALTGDSCGPTPITIAIGGSCTLTYTFSPGAAGAASQNLSITSNAPSSPDILTLQGTGIIPMVSVTPGPLDFGGQEVGTTSSENTVTLSNPGGVDLEISSIDAAVAPFAATGGTCGPAPITIAVGSSCTLTYIFDPFASRAVSQTLSIISNAPSSPDSLRLQGVGISAKSIPTLNWYALVFLALMIIAVVSLTTRRAV